MKRRNPVAIVVAFAGFVAVAIYLCVLAFRSPPDPARMLRETIRGASSKNRVETISRLDDILQNHPGHPATLWERLSYCETDEESLVFLTRIQSGPPEKVAKARLLEGNILLKHYRCQAAIVAFQEAVSLQPSFDEARYRLIPLMALLRKPVAVRQQLQGMREIRKLTLSEMALWITTDDRLTGFPEAKDYLEPFIRTDPADLVSIRSLCIYLMEEARPADAFARLKEALLKSPNDPELIALLGHFLVEAGQISEASRVLESLHPTSESSPEQWQSLAELAFAQGDLNSARVAAEFAALSSPFDRACTYLYFRILSALGDEQAERWQQRVDTLNALHAAVESVSIMVLRKIYTPTPVIRVASLLLQMDRPMEAREWIEAAQSMNAASELLTPLSKECAEQLARFKQEPPVSPVSPVSVWNSMEHRGPLDAPETIETSGSAGSAGIMLIDKSSEMGLQMQYENGHTGMKYLVESMGGGVGVIDFDGDGWPDLYCPQGGTLGEGPELPPLSDMLYRNLRGAAFSDVSQVAGVEEYGYSQGISAGDINGDGFDDVVVANVGRNSVFLNCGDGTFEDVTDKSVIQNSTAMSSSVALADLDGDSDLDLYVVNYVDGLRICRNDKGEIATCNPSFHDGVSDELYENQGDDRFRRATDTAGISQLSGKGLGVVIARLDEDRRPDIFVTNDTTPNLLFVNQSGDEGLRFEERGFPMGVAVNGQGQAEAGMGIACADLDHDLRPDLYVTNFFREANTLLLQPNPGLFQDFTAARGLREPTLSLLGFGTQALDLDLDGWMELFVANGHIDDQTDHGEIWQMPPQLFRTIDGLSWSDISSESGSFMQQKSLGRGVAVLDANRDGHPDLAVGYQDRPLALLINETPNTGNAVVLRLIGVACNRSAINTVVYWEFDGKRLMTELCGGDGYYCTSEHSLTLGLGASSGADLIEVHWPDGRVDEFKNVESGRRYVVRQGLQMVSDPQ